MERCPAPDAGVHLQGLIALDLVDVHDLPLVEDAEVHGLLRRQHEAPEEGRGDLADGAATGDEGADLEGFEPKTVALGLGILPDVPTGRQRREQPVHGALAQPERLTQLGDSNLWALDAERLENSEGVVD